MTRRSEETTASPLALGLGWFSVALGVAELVAPREVARLIGAETTDRSLQTLRVMGARELASGLSILTKPAQAGPVWSRVAGDVVDLALLGRILQQSPVKGRPLAATLAVAGVTALDLLAARRLSQAAAPVADEVYVEHVVTIRKPIEEVYRFWRNVENFPRFMRHLEDVTVSSERLSHWVARGPAGMRFKWDAELIADQAPELISWCSLEGSDVDHRGSVRFSEAPGGRGTEVRVELEYVPPAGRVGKVIAQLFGEEPRQQVKDDLRRVKQLLETGEITVSDGPGLRRPAAPAGDRRTTRLLAGVH